MVWKSGTVALKFRKGGSPLSGTMAPFNRNIQILIQRIFKEWNRIMSIIMNSMEIINVKSHGRE